MDKGINPFPAEDARAVLTEARGIIWQRELKFFKELSERWFREGGEFPPVLDALRESLEERFAHGYLVEMGEAEFYRDHTGGMVISQALSQIRLN